MVALVVRRTAGPSPYREGPRTAGRRRVLLAVAVPYCCGVLVPRHVSCPRSTGGSRGSHPPYPCSRQDPAGTLSLVGAARRMVVEVLRGLVAVTWHWPP